MAMAAEATVICIDNSTRVAYQRGIYHAQLEAIKFYSKTKLKCNPENTVALFTMAKGQYGPRLFPTNSYQKILSCLEKGFICRKKVEFKSSIYGACYLLSLSPPHMKRRVLMFVGGPIDLHISDVKREAKGLKQCGAALDVVNFYLLDIDYESCARFNFSILTGKYCYAKQALDALVTAVNENDNSRIVDVVDESSVVEILSNSILKKYLHYIEKKAGADVEHVEASRIQFVKPDSKNKSVADDEYEFPCLSMREIGQALGTEYGERYPAKKTPQIDFKISEDLSRRRICKQVLEPKKPKENVNLKQALELSHNKNRFQPLQNLGDFSPM